MTNPSSKKESAKLCLSDRIARTLQTDPTLPVFSTAVLKLLDIANNQELDMDTIAEIVKLDPGLTTKYLRLANSVWMGGKPISSIREALIRIGLNEVRKMASAIGVMEVLFLFRSDRKNPMDSESMVEWEMFWLHSLLVARLADSLATAYRPTSGKEYLAGLLHDSGKLFLERYFPKEFASALSLSNENQCCLFDAERKLFNITHADIAGDLCAKWKLDPQIIFSIRWHHRFKSNLLPKILPKGEKDTDGPEFTALCLCLANSLANMYGVNIQKNSEMMDLESLPEWLCLQKFQPRQPLELDVVAELRKAQEAIQILAFKY